MPSPDAKVKLSNKHVLHTVNEPISVMNQSRNSILENRAHLLCIVIHRTASQLEDRTNTLDTMFMLDEVKSSHGYIKLPSFNVSQ